MDNARNADQVKPLVPHRQGEAAALWNSALAFDKLDDRQEAIARAKAALKIFEAIESPIASKVREQLGEWREENSKGKKGKVVE